MIKVTHIRKENGATDTIIYKMPNGSRVQIGSVDAIFFEQLQSLPAPLKIRMMCLSIEDLEHQITKERLLIKEQCIELLQKQWYWRESGDEAIITSDMIPSVPFNQAELLKKCNSKRPPTLNQLRAIVEFFTNEWTEVYLKEEMNNE